MTTSNTERPEDHSPLLTAPDGCTTYRASAVPTSREFADWCHPRRNPDRWLENSLNSSNTASRSHPTPRLSEAGQIPVAST